jgi:hypothetical protein
VQFYLKPVLSAALLLQTALIKISLTKEYEYYTFRYVKRRTFDNLFHVFFLIYKNLLSSIAKVNINIYLKMSASAALTQLVAFDHNRIYNALNNNGNGNGNGNENGVRPNVNNIEIINISPTQRNILSRTIDIIVPEYILIDLNNRSPEMTSEYIIQNYNFNVSIGEEKHYPLQIMEYLEPSSIISRNILKININYKYFFTYSDRGLPLNALPYNEIEFSIKHNITNIPLDNVKLLIKGIYLDTNERRRIASSSFDYRTRNVHTLQINSESANTAFQINGCSGLLNGFILRLNNPDDTVENIENIEIFLNGYSRQIYTREIINIYCQQLSPNAIYIPIDMNSNFRSDNYSASVNLTAIERFGIKIGTNLEQGFNATLYLTIPNIFRANAGMGNYIFADGLIAISYGLEPIPIVLHRTSTNVDTILPEWQVSVISFEIPNNTTCPITFDGINVSNGVCKCIQCNNIFVYSAYRQWIETSRHCPLCRNRNIEYKYYTPDGEIVNYQSNMNMNNTEQRNRIEQNQELANIRQQIDLNIRHVGPRISIGRRINDRNICSIS